ncbi:MAG TPA: hypothetical protein VHM02_11620 [Thermoanaerobaculia bacterium]|nr:hypothetical protein [Thermoanaerobaculia bacterium]
MTVAAPTRYLICLDNSGYEASLVRRKVYRNLPDERAAERGLVRVIDESDEDYLYPASMFLVIEVPEEAAAALARAS